MEGETSRCGRTYFVAGQHKNSEQGFLTRGATNRKEIRIPFSSIWAGYKSDVFLALNFPCADIFRFTDGRLISNYVLSTQIVHSFHSPDGTVVLADRRKELNNTDFTACMMCELSSTSDGRRGIILKFQILIFTATYLEIFENPDAGFGGFPGIKVADGNFPLLPRLSTPWGCPGVPFTLPECRTCSWRRPRRAADSKTPTPPLCGRRFSRWRWTRVRSPSDGSTSLPFSLSFGISPATGLLSGFR